MGLYSGTFQIPNNLIDMHAMLWRTIPAVMSAFLIVVEEIGT